MSKRNMIAVAVSILVLATNVFAADMTASEILKKVATTYSSMQTYKAEGTVVSDIDVAGRNLDTASSFSILLKKPNLYQFSWNTKIKSPMLGKVNVPDTTLGGVAWSDGTQPYLYMISRNAYSKMDSDEHALGADSSGVAFTIPSLFFPWLKEQPFSRLKNPKIEKTETVGGEDCYVVSGVSTMFRKETFWISKSKYLIVRYAHSLEPPEGGRTIPKMTDEQIDKEIEGTGKKPTEESRKSMREMMDKSTEFLKTTKVKGSYSETHAKISSPELKKADFQFVPPKTAVRKDSLFGGALNGGQ